MKKLLANSELPYAMRRPCSGGAPDGVSVRKATSTPTVTGPGRSRPATKVPVPERSTPVSAEAQLSLLHLQEGTPLNAPGSPRKAATAPAHENWGGAYLA